MTPRQQNHASGGLMPPPGLSLPIAGPPILRPSSAIIQHLQKVSSATASAILHKLGVRQTFIQGPISCQPGAKVVGPILTLQFMPQREDVASGVAQEYAEKQSALWAIFESVEPGDIIAVQAYGDPYTGCFGEMLLTYFQGKQGAGVVIDGYFRDWPHVKNLQVPIWARGTTPNYASQSHLFPWAYNVPIACSQVLVLPGDIMIADDDGAVVVPTQLAELVVKETLAHEDWEAFSRTRLAEGLPLRTYYPLNEEGRREYEAWRTDQIE